MMLDPRPKQDLVWTDFFGVGEMPANWKPETDSEYAKRLADWEAEQAAAKATPPKLTIVPKSAPPQGKPAKAIGKASDLLAGASQQVRDILANGHPKDKTPGHWDQLVMGELKKIGLTKQQIKDVWRKTPMFKDAGDWPRGFEGALDRLYENTEDSVIEEMNRQHAVMPVGDKLRVVTFGLDDEFPGRETIVNSMGRDDFKALHNNRRYEFTDAKGKPHSIPLGDFWWNSTARRQHTGGQAFMPHHDERVVGNKLNSLGRVRS